MEKYLRNATRDYAFKIELTLRPPLTPPEERD
jgi:hypothetical protein